MAPETTRRKMGKMLRRSVGNLENAENALTTVYATYEEVKPEFAALIAACMVEIIPMRETLEEVVKVFDHSV